MVQADFVLIYRVFSAKPAWKIVPKNSILRRLLTDEINVQAEHLNQFMYGTNLNHINGLRQLRRIQKSKNLKIYCFLFYEYDGVGLSLVTSPSIVASPLSFTSRNTGRFTWYILKLLISATLCMFVSPEWLLMSTKIVNVFIDAGAWIVRSCPNIVELWTICRSVCI